MNLRSFLGTLFPVAINKVFVLFFSLSVRKEVAVGVDRQNWIPLRHTVSMALIRDWAEEDANEFHRFLWSHHLGYAGYYEAKHAFGKENLVLTRRMIVRRFKEFFEGAKPINTSILEDTKCFRCWMFVWLFVEVY